MRVYWSVGDLMGNVLITFKIMPESPDADMKLMLNQALEIVNEKSAKLEGSEIEPIAFGLKALKLYVIVPDEEGILDSLEDAVLISFLIENAKSVFHNMFVEVLVWQQKC